MLSPLPVLEKQHQPQRLQMSYEEYLNFAPDAQKTEWANGEVIIYMPPSDRHQDLIGFIYNLLRNYIQFFLVLLDFVVTA